MVAGQDVERDTQSLKQLASHLKPIQTAAMGEIPRDENSVDLVRERPDRLDDRLEMRNRIYALLIGPDVEVADLREKNWPFHL